MCLITGFLTGKLGSKIDFSLPYHTVEYTPYHHPQFGSLKSLSTNLKDIKNLKDLILSDAPKSGLMTSLYAFYRAMGIYIFKESK